MRTINLRLCLALAACLLSLRCPIASAADVKTYQVTGPVLELTETSIVVQKGDDRWELARDKMTKVKGTLKVGSKVTIRYRMIAADIEAKEGKEAAPAKSSK